MKVKVKKCWICDKEFIPYSTLNKYCSVWCSKKREKEKAKIKREKKKEKKSESIPVLVELLDKLVSKYIRLKYSKNWICTCISCEKEITIAEAHNCHRINRGNRLYRWDEDNLRPWCSGCNLFNKEFHLRKFTEKQIARLWINKVQEMSEKAREVWKRPTREELFEKISYYKEKVKELEENKQ